MNPHLRHEAPQQVLFDWLQQSDNDQLLDIDQKKFTASRRQEKEKGTTATEVTEEKKVTPIDNTKASRLETERRLSLCHSCHQPVHISATCLNRAKAVSEIQETDTQSKNQLPSPLTRLR